MSIKAAQKTEQKKETVWPLVLMFAAMFYNPVLAAANTHMVPLSAVIVAATEAMVLFAGAGFLFRKLPVSAPRLLFLVSCTTLLGLLAAWVCLFNQALFLKPLRDLLIVFLFYLIGTQSSIAQLIKIFRYATLAVLACLFIEGWFTDVYVTLFNPAAYYAQTRGIEALAVDQSGLFRNSLGFDGRFSYGLFGQRRLSSLFLEQVSLANYSMVLTLFMTALWHRLLRFDKVLFVAAVLFMILVNSSRTGSVLCLMTVMGASVFPKLPRGSLLLTMPAVLICATGLFLWLGPVQTDTLAGRLGHTVYMLASMEPLDVLGGNVARIVQTADSGYAYLVFGLTGFGLLLFWFFLARLLPYRSREQKIFAHATSLYIACNLLVGAAVFSIKVSAPLWLAAGCFAAALPCTRKGAAHEQT